MKKSDRSFYRNLLSIALGSIGGQIMFVFMTNYASIFFTDFLGLSSGIVGTILLLSRIWDGINDPMCGILMERSNPRHGKIQTWMLCGGVVAAIGLVMIFTVPNLGNAGRAAWAAIAYNVMGMGFTAVVTATMLQIPRGAAHPNEQVPLSTAYSIAASVAGIVAGSIIVKLMAAFGTEDPAHGYWMSGMVFAVFGLLFLTGSVVTFRDLSTAKVSGSAEAKPKVGEMLRAIVKVPSFFIITVAVLFGNIGFGFCSADMMYYLTYVLERPAMMAIMLPAMYVGLLGGSTVAGILAGKLGRKASMIIGFLLYVAGPALRMVLGDSTIAFSIGIGLICFGSGLITTLLMPCLADCADYAEHLTGVRCQALTMTGFTMVSKWTTGVAAVVVGFALERSGYITSTAGGAMQPQSALDVIYSLQFWPTIIMAVIGIVILLFYKLDDATMAKIRAAKSERAQDEDSMT